MEPAPDGAAWAPELVRDLGIRPFEIVTQNDEGALFRRQAVERREDLIAQLGGFCMLFGVLADVRKELDDPILVELGFEGDLPVFPSRRLEGIVHHTPQEPGAKALAGVELIDPFICPQKCCLDDIPRQFLITCDQVGRPDGPHLIGADEQL